MIYLTELGISTLIEGFKEQNKFWEKVSTKNNVYYSSQGKGKIYQGETNKGGFSRKELGLIVSVKSQLKKFADKIEKDYTNVDLFNAYSNKLRYDQTNENCIQIDINSAYLSILHNIGAISKKTYDSFFEEENTEKMSESKKDFKQGNKDYKSRQGGILKVSKSCRLVAVGSVAVQKNIQYFKGYEIYKEPDFIYNKKEANIFFYAANLVGKVMSEILETCNGWFFWVDCIFMPNELKEKAFNIFKKHGLEYHYNNCEISFSRHKWNVKFQVTNKEDGEQKEYKFRYSKCLRIEDKFNDPKKILEIYNNLPPNFKACIFDISEQAAEIKIQIADILKIRDKFILLQDNDDLNLLYAILQAIKKDITILF